MNRVSNRPRWFAFKFGKGAACANCPGLCCERFGLPFATVNEDGSFSLEKARKSFTSERDVRDLDFIERNFYTKPVPEHMRELWKGYIPYSCDEAGNRLYKNQDRFAFTCRQFVNGRCQDYANRPYACEGFYCRAAREGSPVNRPYARDFPYQVRVLEDAGIPVRTQFVTCKQEHRMDQVQAARERLLGHLRRRVWLVYEVSGKHAAELVAGLDPVITSANYKEDVCQAAG